MNRIRRKGQRGFSLIELGIVVAVIAILATVVLVGRGFLESSRVSKMVEVIDTIAKGTSVYAGSNGGLIPGANGNDFLPGLIARALVPNAIATSVPNFNVASVSKLSDETFRVIINCTEPNQGPTSCQDICNAKNRDTSIVGGVGSMACGVGTPIQLDFQI